ncbi:segregation/condensation protein A [Salisediminibacterium halotolerans]|uniref:Segregation and condensation protein A n=1 Tax=Salisediminibacterium halotolerans TaxID=517425 RepID=A0A1H9P8K7_9BACI|nr:segregation/condensation protein A [Salisediminibacterium haloalkalitolerans]SER44411.1 condensin subunit ScpA [Salisediminibacterium haloalkalitolerans]
MQYSVKLHSFEGPLDLLLHLINQNDLDLYDIPVREITEQYMTYIHAMQVLHLDIASEYLVMASTLLHMKSQLLLPVEEEPFDDEETWYEEDPRQDLMEKLIEYKKYKEAAEDFKQREKERSNLYSKPITDLTPLLDDSEHNEAAPSVKASLFDLLQAYKKMNIRTEKKAPNVSTIERESIPIDQQMTQIMLRLEKSQGKSTFSQLIGETSPHESVVSFLALLELMKSHAVICKQDGNFQDIWVFKQEVPMLAKS